MSTNLCCLGNIDILRTLEVGEYVWIKAKKIRLETAEEDDLTLEVQECVPAGQKQTASTKP